MTLKVEYNYGLYMLGKKQMGHCKYTHYTVLLCHCDMYTLLSTYIQADGA